MNEQEYLILIENCNNAASRIYTPGDDWGEVFKAVLQNALNEYGAFISSDDDAKGMYQAWKRAVYGSQVMRSTDNFQEAAQHFIEVAKADKDPANDTTEWYKERMNREV